MPKYYILNEDTNEETTYTDSKTWLLKVMEIARCLDLREARQMWIETLKHGCSAMGIGYDANYEVGLL